jgi:hypothetical protein
MRIAENLEVRLSSSGKTFQIVSTSGKKEWAFASIPRDIGDQLFNDDNTWRKLVEAFNEIRDQLPTRETLRNDLIASQHEAKVHKDTPSNVIPPAVPSFNPDAIARARAILFGEPMPEIQIPESIKAMRSAAAEKLARESA